MGSTAFKESFVLSSYYKKAAANVLRTLAKHSADLAQV